MNIYTDRIFDLFHRGHIEFLNNIKKKYPNSNLIVGIINYKEVMMETLVGFKRAGANIIISYHAKDACRYL